MKLHLVPNALLPAGGQPRQEIGAGFDVESHLPPLVRAAFDAATRLNEMVVRLRRNAAERAELSHFSDYELADIGLNRGDVGRVHDPDFAAEYSSARATGQSLKWL